MNFTSSDLKACFRCVYFRNLKKQQHSLRVQHVASDNVEIIPFIIPNVFFLEAKIKLLKKTLQA